jgi:hypothetical protein
MNIVCESFPVLMTGAEHRGEKEFAVIAVGVLITLK